MKLSKKIIAFGIIIVVLFPVLAYSYTSLNYSLTNPRIIPAGGKASSFNYSLNNVIIGKFLSGKIQSANYTLDATGIDETLSVSVPALNPVTTPTNTSTQTISGTKETNTSIWINGIERVSINRSSSWSVSVSLLEGNNTLNITSKDEVLNESQIAQTTILLDTSAPDTPTVIDDGVYTTDSSKLHASWTSSDAETGIVEYQYAIGTSAGGTDIVNWVSTGLATDITHTGLTLLQGQIYYISIKAKNGAGDWSQEGASNGIKMNQSIPTIIDIQPPDTSAGYTQDNVDFSVIAQDADGDSLLYQFSVDAQIIQSWQGSSNFNWSTQGVNSGAHTITTEVSDGNGGNAAQDVDMWLFRKPPAPPLP